MAVLSDVSLSFAPGDAAAIMGPSGSGKSTLLYILGALEPPTTGTVTLDGRNPFSLSPKDLAAFRNKEIGFVFQDHCLLPQCSVLENVLVPTLVGAADAGSDAHARLLVDQVGLGASRRRIFRDSCRAARSSGSRSRARSSAGRGCCCATSRRAISIAHRPTRSPRCCSSCSSSRRPFSSS